METAGFPIEKTLVAVIGPESQDGEERLDSLSHMVSDQCHKAKRLTRHDINKELKEHVKKYRDRMRYRRVGEESR